MFGLGPLELAIVVGMFAALLGAGVAFFLILRRNRDEQSRGCLSGCVLPVTILIAGVICVIQLLLYLMGAAFAPM